MNVMPIKTSVFGQKDVMEYDLNGRTAERWTIPDLQQEYADTLRAIVAGTDTPMTVLHALIMHRDYALTIDGVAAVLGQQTYEVEGVLASLEAAGWIIRFSERGQEKYLLDQIESQNTMAEYPES